MKLFKPHHAHHDRLVSVDLKSFPTEKSIQTLVEQNMQELFGIDVVKSELTVESVRIDTLCFSQETKSFVIVEYKRGQSRSVVDQGFAYLSVLLDRKANFVLKYTEATGVSLGETDVDWSQSRVMFISPRFTRYQKMAVNFQDVPFELWEIRRYAGGILGLVRHEGTSQARIGELGDASSGIAKVSSDVKVYTENHHNSATLQDGVWENYEAVRDRLLELDDVEMSPVKSYIGFKRQNRLVASVALKKKEVQIIINLKKGALDDPLGGTEDVSDKGHLGTGDYRYRLRPPGDDLDYLMTLLRQSHVQLEATTAGGT